MNLFGCKFCEKKKDGSGDLLCDRKNFDSLLWATVTVFQVLSIAKTIATDDVHYHSYRAAMRWWCNFWELMGKAVRKGTEAGRK